MVSFNLNFPNLMLQDIHSNASIKSRFRCCCFALPFHRTVSFCWLVNFAFYTFPPNFSYLLLCFVFSLKFHLFLWVFIVSFTLIRICVAFELGLCNCVKSLDFWIGFVMLLVSVMFWIQLHSVLYFYDGFWFFHLISSEIVLLVKWGCAICVKVRIFFFVCLISLCCVQVLFWKFVYFEWKSLFFILILMDWIWRVLGELKMFEFHFKLMVVWCFRCVWGINELLLKMEDLAGLVEATGTRFTSLELIGQGSFGDVYKG